MSIPLLQQPTWKQIKIGLGLAALGRPGYINLGHADDLERDYEVNKMEARTHKVLDEAWRLGIRYFDAAQSYGKAEEFLSSWLSQRVVPVSEVAVGSKWGYTYTADWKVEAEVHEVKEHSLKVLNNQWTSSKQRLFPYLQLYQIHSATFSSGVLTNVEVLERLAQLKLEGVKIGLSLSGPEQGEVLKKAMEVVIDGVSLFEAVQATWNILERSAEGALKEAHEAGYWVIIKEALANGRLTDRNKEASFLDKMDVMQKELGRLGEERQDIGLDAFALAAVLERKWVDMVLSGAATISHLQANLKALELDWDNEAELSIIPLREHANDYWSKRKSLVWN